MNIKENEAKVIANKFISELSDVERVVFGKRHLTLSDFFDKFVVLTKSDLVLVNMNQDLKGEVMTVPLFKISKLSFSKDPSDSAIVLHMTIEDGNYTFDIFADELELKDLCKHYKHIKSLSVHAEADDVFSYSTGDTARISRALIMSAQNNEVKEQVEELVEEQGCGCVDGCDCNCSCHENTETCDIDELFEEDTNQEVIPEVAKIEEVFENSEELYNPIQEEPVEDSMEEFSNNEYTQDEIVETLFTKEDKLGALKEALGDNFDEFKEQVEKPQVIESLEKSFAPKIDDENCERILKGLPIINEDSIEDLVHDVITGKSSENVSRTVSKAELKAEVKKEKAERKIAAKLEKESERALKEQSGKKGTSKALIVLFVLIAILVVAGATYIGYLYGYLPFLEPLFSTIETQFGIVN